MAHAVEYRTRALRGLARLPARTAARIMTRLDDVAEDPRRKDNALEPIKGLPNGFRLRVGDYRACYILSPATIDVFEVAHKKDTRYAP